MALMAVHQLNCAKLMPHPDGKPNPCSCGSEPPRESSQVHNHGPDEGRGLDCPEYNRVDGSGKVGACRLGQVQAFVTFDGEPAARYPVVPEFVDEGSLGEPFAGPPVDWSTLGRTSGGPRSSEATGEVRTVSETGAEKGVKLARYDLIPPEALREVAEHYGKSLVKYEPHNWRKGFEWSKSYAALQRHAQDFWAGEDLDEDGQSNLAAVVFHALTLMTFQIEQPQYDDRFKKES